MILGPPYRNASSNAVAASVLVSRYFTMTGAYNWRPVSPGELAAGWA